MEEWILKYLGGFSIGKTGAYMGTLLKVILSKDESLKERQKLLEGMLLPRLMKENEIG